MAKNKVEIDVKVDDKGTMKKVGLESKKAADGLDKTARSAQTADRNLKGTAQTSANSTKNFAKMSQGMGGLVAAYATLAANIFAISAAFNFLKSAGDLRVLEEGQIAYAEKTGKSLSLLTSQVQAATGQLLNFQDAAQAVSIGTAAGLNNSQIVGLADVAKRASMALGRDLTDSFNRLTRGAVKAEPELLDELGIIIRLDTVTKDYARSINKAAKDLTTFQKTQAVVNAVIDQGTTKFDDLGGSVNQVAKLGKSFNDVINTIREAIIPLAEFIATGLSNNIMALAGAFAFLGTGITKSLAGAPPALEDIAGAADDARASLQGAAGTSKIGQKLSADPSSLSESELQWVENSARSKSSTIINYDNITKKAVINNIRVIRAEQELSLAKQQTGVKRFYAMWKAELKMLQATHGTVMGTMKAGVQGFARVANFALGAAGIIGLLFTAIGLLKELMNKFKSDEFKRFLENNKALKDIFNSQVKEVKDLADKLKDTSNEAERLEQTANLISNISFRNLEGFKLDKISVNEFLSDETKDKFEEQRKTIGVALNSLNIQIQNFEKRGLDASPLKKRAEIISNALKELPTTLSTYYTGQQAEPVNKFIALINEELAKLPETNQKLIKPVTDAQTALKGLIITGDEFTQLKDKLNTPPSKFTEFLKITADTISGLEGSNLRNISDLTEAQQVAVEKILGDMSEIKTIEQAVTLLKQKQEKILETERELLLDKITLETKYEKLNRGATPLIKARLALQKQEAQVQQEIDEILAGRTLLELANLAVNDTTKKQEVEKLLLLQEQLTTIQRQQQEFARLKDSATSAFEGSLQTGIADIIKGQESSLKDAMLKIAQATLNSVADTLSEIITEKIMGSIFKQEDPAIKNAHTAGAEVVKQKIIEGHKQGLGASGKLPALEEIKVTAKKLPLPDSVMEEPIKKDKIIVSEALDSHVKNSALLYDKGEGTKEISNIFSGFTEKLSGIFSKDNPLLSGLGDIFGNLLGGFGNLFSGLFSGLGGLFGGAGGGGLSSLLGLFTGFLGFAKGGYAPGGFRAFADGGMVTKPTLGLVGEGKMNEAIVPLPNGRSIPVDMKGIGQNNNVVVNVSVDSQGNGQTTTESQSGADAGNLGQAIARAVQQELQNQKRSGGILNPYGVS